MINPPSTKTYTPIKIYTIYDNDGGGNIIYLDQIVSGLGVTLTNTLPFISTSITPLNY